MNNPFLIDISYRVRHKILEVLYNDWKNHNRDNTRVVSSITIADTTRIPIGDIHTWQYLLVSESEISVSDNDGQFMMSLQSQGITAYINKKYIQEGRKKKWDNTYDWARILIPLAALILSAYTLFISKSASNKVNELEKRIEKLKK
jgi:hypothetical protein